MHPLTLPAFSKKRVHLGTTGSVAAYKGLELLRLFVKTDIAAGATLTSAALRFITPLSFTSLGADPVYTALFDEGLDTYAHLAPGQTAHALIIAPATANILAKLAHGLADDMLSAQALSFDGPLVLAPCMNPKMWNHPATKANWEILLSRGALGIPPSSGTVACGDTGQGRLAEPWDIYVATLKALAPKDLAGQNILITLGPTREPFDKVRFWSNPSSGKMGWSLALCAWLRGARVTVVHGPTSLSLPKEITTLSVNTAQEMFTACMDVWPNMDIGCCNPDILQTMGENKTPSQRLIGFAAEAEKDLQAAAQTKLKAKHLDLIVCNRIDMEGSGFAGWNNSVLLVDAHGTTRQMDNRPKTEIAWRIWDWI